jgi:hypothetical protein
MIAWWYGSSCIQKYFPELHDWDKDDPYINPQLLNFYYSTWVIAGDIGTPEWEGIYKANFKKLVALLDSDLKLKDRNPNILAEYWATNVELAFFITTIMHCTNFFKSWDYDHIIASCRTALEADGIPLEEKAILEKRLGIWYYGSNKKELAVEQRRSTFDLLSNGNWLELSFIILCLLRYAYKDMSMIEEMSFAAAKIAEYPPMYSNWFKDEIWNLNDSFDSFAKNFISLLR